MAQQTSLSVMSLPGMIHVFAPKTESLAPEITFDNVVLLSHTLWRNVYMHYVGVEPPLRDDQYLLSEVYSVVAGSPFTLMSYNRAIYSLITAIYGGCSLKSNIISMLNNWLQQRNPDSPEIVGLENVVIAINKTYTP